MLSRSWVRRGPKKWIKESEYLRYIQALWPEVSLWGREPGDLPSFLIIGAQRSGTTFLHDHLSASTGAKSSPLRKEIHYFDNKYYRSLEWYAKFFGSTVGGEEDRSKNFETSPYYLYHPAVPQRVAKSLPNSDILVVLRDPVDRAISHYRWMRQIGLETRDAIQAFRYDAKRRGLEQNNDYLEQFEDPFYFNFDHIFQSYLRRSLYHIQLRRWLECFDSSQIRVVSSNALFRRTETVINELAMFLGVDYRGQSCADTINRNSSRRSIPVCSKARALAERFLKEEARKVQELVPDEMIVGNDLELE